jgi:hypothetical protein
MPDSNPPPKGPPPAPIDLLREREDRRRTRRERYLEAMEDADLDDPAKLMAWMATHQTDALYSIAEQLHELAGKTRDERIASDPELHALLTFHAAIVDAARQVNAPDAHPGILRPLVLEALRTHQARLDWLDEHGKRK